MRKFTRIKALIMVVLLLAAVILPVSFPSEGTPLVLSVNAEGVGVVPAVDNVSGTQNDSFTDTSLIDISSDSRIISDSTAFTETDRAVLRNVVGAVETGSQIYGNRRYDAYVPAYYGGPFEYTCTLGWCSFYGDNAERLIQMIYAADPVNFANIDQNGLIRAKLTESWVDTRWDPTLEEAAILVALITSDAGKKCQDLLFDSLTQRYISECQVLYPGADKKAMVMYCEIAWLGGTGSAQRIFTRCGGNYSLGAILQSLMQDETGDPSSTLVGAAKYWRRHMLCAFYIAQNMR